MSVFSLQQIGQINHPNILFDACILIDLFYPKSSNDPKEIARINAYTQAYANIVQDGRLKCFVHFVTISEFVNRCLKFEFEYKASSFENFKTFRQSKDGGQAQSKVFSFVKQLILPNFSLVDLNSLQGIQIQNFLSLNIDFTDKVLAEVCKKDRYTLFTDDGDFKKQTGFDILTRNQKYFPKKSKTSK